jgi:hypothetical protein
VVLPRVIPVFSSWRQASVRSEPPHPRAFLLRSAFGRTEDQSELSTPAAYMPEARKQVGHSRRPVPEGGERSPGRQRPVGYERLHLTGSIVPVGTIPHGEPTWDRG